MLLHKTCCVCKANKPISDFHANRKAKDGKSGKCKPCALHAAKIHREQNSDHFKLYDKARATDPARVAARVSYKRTEKGKSSHSASMQRYNEKHPDRYKAKSIFGHQLRIGAIQPQPCQVCGEGRTEGHHPDYSRPLDVVWLCVPHHKEVHRMTKEIGK